MGKIQLHTTEQEIIFEQVRLSDLLASQFYFTGGTALSAVYLNHRYSDDLDFFSQSHFDNLIIQTLVKDWSEKNKFTFTSRFIEVVYVFQLTFQNQIELKVDFSYYPYKKIGKDNVIDGFRVDSLIDIAVNKLITISQRTDVKDFVDLYYLLQTFSLWDLREGVRVKFGMEIEPLILAADMLKVDDFTFMPRMIKPLSLEELQRFFRSNAQKMGKDATK